jgi:hypothetical protein
LIGRQLTNAGMPLPQNYRGDVFNCVPAIYLKDLGKDP